MQITGKSIRVNYRGGEYTLYNQRCREWTHPYAWEGRGTLTDSGCGIFSLANAAGFLGGEPVAPEALADFSCRFGGRGDDGTDRPALLAAMEREGLARRHGFSYAFDGLRNDRDTLYAHLMSGGAALCNLRPGHIVALVEGREANGEKQVLAADPFSESADSRVAAAVRECLPGSEIVSPLLNGNGLCCGFLVSYALFWASLDTVRDFNLLHPIFPRR